MKTSVFEGRSLHYITAIAIPVVFGLMALLTWYLLGYYWGFPILGILLATQSLFLLGAGTLDLHLPLGRKRLLAPVFLASLMMTMLAGALIIAIGDLFWRDVHFSFWTLFTALATVNLIGWGVYFYTSCRYLSRLSVLSKLVSRAFIGSVFVLPVCFLAEHVVWSRGGAA